MKKPKVTLSYQRITSVFLILLCTVFLLAVDGTGYERISSFKVALFYTICGGYAALMLLLVPESVLVGALPMDRAWRLIRPTNAAQGFALGYLIISVLSALLSGHSQAWLGTSRYEGVLSIAIYVLCFYFVSKFALADERLLYIFGGSVSVFCVICILQLQGLDPFSMYPEGYNYFDAGTAYSGAYLGTIGNVDFVAAFLCIAVGILAAVLCVGKGRKRFFLVIALLLALWVMFDMAVLAGWIGVLCGGAVCLPFVCQRVLPIGKKGQWLIFAALAVTALCAVVLLYCVDVGQGFLHEVHLLLHGQTKDTFGSGRIYIWKNVWSRLGENLLLGHGPDTLSLAQIPPFTRFDETLGLQIVASIDSAHNEYLGVLYHQGILGLICYVGLIISTLREAFSSPPSVVRFSAGCAVILYSVQAFFGVSQPLTTPFFWVVLGLSVIKDK